jgi:hypothetical protein
MRLKALTEDQRINIVAALVKRRHIVEDQMLQARDDLMEASDEDLHEVCEELAPEAWPT